MPPNLPRPYGSRNMIPRPTERQIWSPRLYGLKDFSICLFQKDKLYFVTNGNCFYNSIVQAGSTI